MADPEAFQSYRPLLFAIAYRMLGSASEADDVLQDAYLRYAAAESQRGAGQPAEIRSLKAYLSTIVTRLCRIGSRPRRRCASNTWGRGYPNRC